MVAIADRAKADFALLDEFEKAHGEYTDRGNTLVQIAEIVVDTIWSMSDLNIMETFPMVSPRTVVEWWRMFELKGDHFHTTAADV